MPRKYILIISNLIIAFIIMLGFVLVIYTNTISCYQLVQTQIEETVTLTVDQITQKVESWMIEPVIVAKTMASDRFLQNWIAAEQDNLSSADYENTLCHYLKNFQEKYHYDTVFFVSSSSGRYYYQDGINKIVSPQDEHDIWYYNFLEMNQENDIELDLNQTANDAVTIFTNFRMEDDEGNLLGVAGVGFSVANIQQGIEEYEERSGMTLHILNQGSADNSFDRPYKSFISEEELQEALGGNSQIDIAQFQENTLNWVDFEDGTNCVIVKEIPSLRWYLIAYKTSDSIAQIFFQQMSHNFIYIVLILFSCVAITSAVAIYMNGKLLKMENIDALTDIPNNRLFEQQFRTMHRKRGSGQQTFFMFDIDHFKNLNDSKGHLYGNMVLSYVAKELKELISDRGICARWGGDEFVGALYLSSEEAKVLLGQFAHRLEYDHEEFHVTISCGLTQVKKKSTLTELIAQADHALYYAKEHGRNNVTVYENISTTVSM